MIVVHAVERLLSMVGLATPFGLAWATYLIFHRADSKASEPLKEAISGWLRRQPYQRTDWQSVIVGMMFDRLYTYPLIRPRAILRSLIISMMVFVAFISISSPALSVPTVLIIAPYLASVILSDYLSLFVVRRCLLFSNDYPMMSLLLSFFFGSIVIVFAFFCGFEIQRYFIVRPIYVVILSNHLMPIPYWIGRGTAGLPILNLVIPALLVHFWLPLFAAGAFTIRFLYRFAQAAVWAQWALKQGNRHPLEAIGFVAAAFIFAVAAVWKLLLLL
jgi:hypothetical protein